MSQPEHQRVAAGVDELVDPPRLEPAGNVDVRVRRDQCLLGALVVEAAATFDASEAPAVGRHSDPLVIGIAPPRQMRLARVQ